MRVRGSHRCLADARVPCARPPHRRPRVVGWQQRGNLPARSSTGRDPSGAAISARSAASAQTPTDRRVEQQADTHDRQTARQRLPRARPQCPSAWSASRSEGEDLRFESEPRDRPRPAQSTPARVHGRGPQTFTSSLSATSLRTSHLTPLTNSYTICPHTTAL